MIYSDLIISGGGHWFPSVFRLKALRPSTRQMEPANLEGLPAAPSPTAWISLYLQLELETTFGYPESAKANGPQSYSRDRPLNMQPANFGPRRGHLHERLFVVHRGVRQRSVWMTVARSQNAQWHDLRLTASRNRLWTFGIHYNARCD